VTRELKRTRARGSDVVNTVEGQRGFKWWTNIIFYTSGLTYMLWIASVHVLEIFKSAVSQQDARLYFIPFVLSLASLYMIIFIWNQLSSTICVSQHEIHIQSGRLSVFLPFNKVQKIGAEIGQTKYDTWKGMVLTVEKNQTEVLDLRQYDNYKILELSVLECVVRLNPKVEIDEHWLHTYGSKG
jgi:hypothetical protein